MGTIIEGNTEFFSSRLTKRARKETILEEVMANKDSTSRFKNKFNEIQISKKSGRKEYYKKMKEKRKSNK